MSTDDYLKGVLVERRRCLRIAEKYTKQRRIGDDYNKPAEKLVAYMAYGMACYDIIKDIREGVNHEQKIR